jgi:hypothetical protein
MTLRRTQAQSILLYNPISGHGHLDSWNALFVRFLLEAGWQVASLSPGADDLRSRLTQKNLAHHPNLQVLEWRTPQRSLSERIRSKLWRMFSAGVGHKHSEANRELEARYLQPLEFAQRVRDATIQLSYKPQIVFNMYMDLYRADAVGWAPFAQIHKLPWAGIRFVPSPAQDAITRTGVQPSEAYYQLTTLAGMCFLDEQLCQQYARQLPEKYFEYLPDVTENSLPSQASDIASEITRRAAGRKIVFLGGTIGGNKNLSQWFALIAMANSTEWFFVQIGEVYEQSLSAADLTAYQQAKKAQPENFFLKAEYLPDERLFNSVIAASDILFAVYRNFSISSNMLGKSAAFEKPILVAEGFLMGARVEQYQIGLTVPEADTAKMLSAITQLSMKSEARVVARAEHFAAYRQDFSHDALKARFFSFLEKTTLARTSSALFVA